MRRKKNREIKILDDLVYGNITDVIKLVIAMRSGKLDEAEIDTLDLRPIKAFKATPQGGFEVTLYDRLAVRAALKESTSEANSIPLYEAIAYSARAIAEVHAGSQE